MDFFTRYREVRTACGSGKCIGYDKATKYQKYSIDVVIGVQR